MVISTFPFVQHIISRSNDFATIYIASPIFIIAYYLDISIVATDKNLRYASKKKQISQKSLFSIYVRYAVK